MWRLSLTGTNGLVRGDESVEVNVVIGFEPNVHDFSWAADTFWRGYADEVKSKDERRLCTVAVEEEYGVVTITNQIEQSEVNIDHLRSNMVVYVIAVTYSINIGLLWSN